jgi:hypothetical protein
MHLRSWRDERHQTPKNNFQNFRFAASICTLSGLGLSKGIECAAVTQRARPSLAFRIQAQSRLRDVVQNVMAITDALAGSGTSKELRGGGSDRNQKGDPMNTKHRHGSVDARTELLDIVQGTTACSQMVFNGLLAWAYLHARNPSKAHTQTRHTGWML